MKKFVHKYLASFFEVKTIESNVNKKLTLLEFDAIVSKETKTLVYANRLLKELVSAAYIDEVTLKAWIEEWVYLCNPNADLKLYWIQEEPEFPHVNRVIAQTVGLDLIRVQPLEAPKGQLFYFDYQYSGTTELNNNDRTYNNETFKSNVAQLIENQRKALLGELDHPDSEEIERQSWFNPQLNKKDLETPN